MGFSTSDLPQPMNCPEMMSSVSFVFPLRPEHQVVLELAERWVQHRAIERAVVIDPPSHCRIEHVREVAQPLVAALADVPASYLCPDRFGCLVADRGAEVHKHLAPTILRQSRSKRVSEEVKPFVLMMTTPVPILAVYD